MNLHEVRFRTPMGTSSSDVTEAARGAAERLHANYTIVGTTTHARPTDTVDTAAMMVMYTGFDDPDFDELYGILAREHGYQPTYTAAVGEDTLNLKNDTDAIEALEASARGDDDEQFTITPPTDDEDDFTITND